MMSCSPTAVVTGAGSGIGRVVARALLAPATTSRWPAAGRMPWHRLRWPPRCTRLLAVHYTHAEGCLRCPLTRPGSRSRRIS